LSDGPTDQVQERNKQPLENRLEHLEELIEIQSTKNDEAQSVLDRTVIIASIYRDMRDEMLGDQ
jgi:hypothetical protein